MSTHEPPRPPGAASSAGEAPTPEQTVDETCSVHTGEGHPLRLPPLHAPHAGAHSMTTDPYVYTDPHGDTLTITPTPHSLEVRLTATDTASGDQVSITVRASQLLELVTAMFDGSGSPTPLILERPSATHGHVTTPDGLVALQAGHVVLVPRTGTPRIIHDPQALAAALATVNQALHRSIADAAQVERLAACITQLPDGIAHALAERIAGCLVSQFSFEERGDDWRPVTGEAGVA